MFPIKCKCGSIIRRYELEKHKIEKCPLEEVKCIIEGCTAKILRKNLREHVEKDTLFHFQLLVNQINALKIHNNHMKDHNEELLNIINKLRDENKSLKSEVNSSSKNILKLKNQIAQLQKENKKIKEQIQEYKTSSDQNQILNSSAFVCKVEGNFFTSGDHLTHKFIVNGLKFEVWVYPNDGGEETVGIYLHLNEKITPVIRWKFSIFGLDE